MTVRSTTVRAAQLMLLFITIIGCGPRGSETRGDNPPAAISWMTLATDSGLVRVAVARPSGQGPFPAVLILHGTHGFANEYVELAADLAEEGILSFAACWFEGGAGAGQRFMSRVACEGGPRFVDAPGSDRFRLSRIAIDTLAKVLGARPDVRGLAAFGHSRGGGAALDYALLKHHALSALILNSAGYPDEVITRAAKLPIPVLLMHGETDDPADGGSEMTVVKRARRFEEALKRSGVVVESKYYPGGHNSLFADSAQYVDAVLRIANFVQRRVRG